MNSSLKSMAAAQADFRSNDRDGDKIQSFWRKDVAGLYTLEVDGAPLKLIELSEASADARPAAPSKEIQEKKPKAGYWLAAMGFEDEETPDPNRFAFCAYPGEYGDVGTSTYIISHDYVVYKKDLGHGNGLAVYPSDLAAEGWVKLD